MNFDDHEIWGAPARASEAAPEAPATASEPEPASAAAGRLYRSVGSDPHPEAVVALPRHRRQTSSHPVEVTDWANTHTALPPITINSRLPRAAEIEDAAIAEVLATPANAEGAGTAGFTSWFKSPQPETAAPASGRQSLPLPRTNDVARSLGQFASLSGKAFGAWLFAAVVFAVTAVTATVNAVTSSTLGLPTGIALVVSTAFAAWRIDASARWAAWVLPAYALIAAVLVGGQFTSGSPGASPIGQIMLIATALITLAPWLAAATVIGLVVPALHRRSA